MLTLFPKKHKIASKHILYGFPLVNIDDIFIQQVNDLTTKLFAIELMYTIDNYEIKGGILMFSVKHGYSQNPNSLDAAKELADNLKQENVKFVMFYAPSTYDHKILAQELNKEFESAVVVGSSCGGQIIPQLGYTDDKLAGFSISGDDLEVSATLIKNVKTKAMMSKPQIQETAKKINFNQNSNGFGLLLVDGLSFSEEKVLLAVNSALPNVPVIGGSSSDSWEFIAAYISLNGEVCTDAAILTLIKTPQPFMCYKENIYGSTDNEFKITEINGPRCISKINGRPAGEVYAEVLGCTVEELPQKFMYNPIGRVFGKEIWILTPTEVTPDGGVVVFGNVIPNSTIQILTSLNPVKVAEETAQKIKETLPDIEAIIGFNCMMRHRQFKNEGNGKEVYDKIGDIAPFVGICSYGEQLGKIHCNQTLTLVAIGK